MTLGLTKRPSNNVQFQAYYTYSKDKSDDDNERDPVHVPLREDHRSRRRVRLLRPRPAPPLQQLLLWNAPYGRQRERALLVPLRAAEVDHVRAAPRLRPDASQARFIEPHAADRINPDGSVTQRNLGRKDNEYSSLDLRLSKEFALGTA